MFPFWRSRFFILMAIVFSLAACATGTNLAKTGAIEVKIEDMPKISIQGVTIYEDHDETIVYGHVQRLGVYDNAFIGKQVTAKSVFPDGSIFEKTDRLLTRTPTFRSFRTIYPVANFKIVFPERLPPGTTLVLSFGNRVGRDV